MNRIWKQLTFGSVYLAILILIAGGVYLIYLKPAPSCIDNKQNQKETGVDCGGSCIPCEVKNLNPIAEEVKAFPAGDDKVTLLAKVKNPSRTFTANFIYRFELGGTLLSQSQKLIGKASIRPQAMAYIVIPGVIASPEDIKSVNLKIEELSWIELRSPPLDIEIRSQTDIDETGVIVRGGISNKSAINIKSINLTAILFDRKGDILNASLTRVEQVEAFSQKPFTVFFPEVEGLVQDIGPQKTEIQWELNE